VTQGGIPMHTCVHQDNDRADGNKQNKQNSAEYRARIERVGRRGQCRSNEQTEGPDDHCPDASKHVLGKSQIGETHEFFAIPDVFLRRFRRRLLTLILIAAPGADQNERVLFFSPCRDEKMRQRQACCGGNPFLKFLK